jgi:hypothetical protein
MKKSIVRIASATWIIGTLLIMFGSLSVPPADLPLYIGLACIAIVPIVFGSYRYRIFGIVAITGSLMLAYLQFEAGLHIHAQMDRLKQEINPKPQLTNATPSQPQNP